MSLTERDGKAMTDAELDRIERDHRGLMPASKSDLLALLAEVRKLRESNRLLAETNRHNVETLLAKSPSWTSEPPKVPGWYWWRPRGGGEVQITAVGTEGVRPECPLMEGEYTRTPGEWCGPLTPPGSPLTLLPEREMTGLQVLCVVLFILSALGLIGMIWVWSGK